MAAGRQGFLKRSLWLLAAFLLLAAGSALMLKPAELRRSRNAIAFPRYPSAEDLDRQRRRSTLLLPTPDTEADAQAPPATTGPAPASPGERYFDTLQLAVGGTEFAVVLEARAVQDSPLGQMLLDCLSPDQATSLAELEARTGLRPLEQIERIAIAGADAEDPVLMLSGQFAGFDPSGAFGDSVQFEPQGEHVRWAESGDRAIASWNEELLFMGRVDGVRAAVTRLEREPTEAAAQLADEAYGEAYGSLSGGVASTLLPEQLRERFAQAAERVTLHVDARDDLLLVADVYGSQQDLLKDLASTIGGALALGRLHAVRSEDPLLADLLDESRVIPGNGGFQVEVALPLVSIREQLGECARASAGQRPK